jgi:hypothetical protein
MYYYLKWLRSGNGRCIPGAIKSIVHRAGQPCTEPRMKIATAQGEGTMQKISASIAIGMRVALCLAAATIVMLATLPARSAVTDQQAQQLKTTLTPLGGERAGNKDGTIPAWTGGYTTVPTGYKSGDPRPDPFASDKPLYTITSANATQYQDKLMPGELELLKKYPDTYQIQVYPTHRTAAAPDYVYENTYKNALRAKTTNNGLSIEGAYGGIPFPIPQDGYEAMWNHLLAWKGVSYSDTSYGWLMTTTGDIVLASVATSNGELPYYFKDGSPETFMSTYNGIYLRQFVWITEPPYQNGNATMILNNIDTYGKGEAIWQYLPGQRRVRMAPSLTYDTPNFFVSGVGQMDDFNLFYGAFDRYDFKLVGKKEMIVPYNMNKLRLLTKEQQMELHHANPNAVRYELHRVWVVEANLSSGKRNAVAKRVIYLDEDTWQAVGAEEWDASGGLWRHILGITLDVPEAPATVLWGQITYDFHTGVYVLDAVSSPDLRNSYTILPKPYPADYFTPDAMAARMSR